MDSKRFFAPLFVVVSILLLGGCASFEPPPSERTGPPVNTGSTFDEQRDPTADVEEEDPESSPVEDPYGTTLEDLRNRRHVEVRETSKATVITVGSRILFDLRSAKIRREAWPTLDEIAKYLAREDDRWILVAGHTDTLPTRTQRFPSNWELSALRAVNVVKYLSNLETLDDASLIASGFGKHHPIASNKTEEGRRQNRRLEIFVLKDDFTADDYPGR